VVLFPTLSALAVVAVFASCAFAAFRGGRAGVIAVAASLALLPLSVWGPWLYNVARCGGQPLSLTSFAAAGSATYPGHSGYSRTWFLTSGWACDKREANRRGFTVRE
jgi:hypothetical protein